MKEQIVKNSRSPKIDHLMATMTYFSPTKRTNQNQLIETIRILGKQVFDQQQQTNDQKIINIISHPPIQKHVEQQLNYFNERKNRGLQQKNQMKPKYNTLKDNCYNQTLYDKYQDHQVLKKYQTVENKVKQIIIVQKSKLNISTKSKKYQKVPSKVYQTSHIKNLNYQKFVKRNIKQQQVGIENNNLKDLQKVDINKNNTNNSKFVTKPRKAKNNQQIDDCFKNVIKKSEEISLRKQQNIEKIRSQNLKKQVIQLTLTPQRYSKQMRSDISSEERNRIISLRSNKKKIQLNDEILEKFPFTPKVNKNQFVLSKVKSMWSKSANQSKFLNHTVKPSTGDMSYRTNKDKSFNTTMQIPIKDLKQLSFLLKS